VSLAVFRELSDHPSPRTTVIVAEAGGSWRLMVREVRRSMAPTSGGFALRSTLNYRRNICTLRVLTVVEALAVASPATTTSSSSGQEHLSTSYALSRSVTRWTTYLSCFYANYARHYTRTRSTLQIPYIAHIDLPAMLHTKSTLITGLLCRVFVVALLLYLLLMMSLIRLFSKYVSATVSFRIGLRCACC